MSSIDNKTICAMASAQGVGAVSIIRLSGSKAIEILDTIFKSNSPAIANKQPKKLSETETHKMRFGTIVHPNTLEVIDEVLVAIFRAPHSYTGEESAEIYCHGSDYIVSELLRLLIQSGASLAGPGEFTQRAFLNGKLDLAQAEAVADLISAQTKAAHDVALSQMKGGFSNELSQMRNELVDLVSLMELELDFSEEDVEFADRDRLASLLQKVLNHITSLIDSFALGNVIKNGVPVAIVGATNTGKSTLLNGLLCEERAIVSDIPGTTRDVIEDTINIDGITFRFIDTAGIRNTTETIEMIGIERTFSKMKQASIVILMLDSQRDDEFEISICNLVEHIGKSEVNRSDIFLLLNKADLIEEEIVNQQLSKLAEIAKIHSLSPTLIAPISAKRKIGIEKIKKALVETRTNLSSYNNATLVTNLRHYEALKSAQESLYRVQSGLKDQIPTDLIAQDIREALYYIGTIVGEISNEEILGAIFSKFCIGK